jgi:hypothetical protein
VIAGAIRVPAATGHRFLSLELHFWLATRPANASLGGLAQSI